MMRELPSCLTENQPGQLCSRRGALCVSLFTICSEVPSLCSRARPNWAHPLFPVRLCISFQLENEMTVNSESRFPLKRHFTGRLQLRDIKADAVTVAESADKAGSCCEL